MSLVSCIVRIDREIIVRIKGPIKEKATGRERFFGLLIRPVFGPFRLVFALAGVPLRFAAVASGPAARSQDVPPIQPNSHDTSGRRGLACVDNRDGVQASPLSI